MSKHLMDSEKLREMLEEAFDAGYDRGRISEGAVLKRYPPDFDNWYKESCDGREYYE